MAAVFTGAVVAKVQGVPFVVLRMESIMQGSEIHCVAQTFRELIEEQNVRKLVVDFRSVEYFSSQMLSLIIDLNRKLEETGGKLVLLGLHPRLRELFHITGVEKFFTFAPTEPLALIFMRNESEEENT
jgi:anti-anti-sigma factor